jgi:hypothetical protein
MRPNWCIGAVLAALVSLPIAVQPQSATEVTTVSLATPGFSNELCRVTDDAYSGINNLSNQFDMSGADQGISVDDPIHHFTWMFFGDAAAVDANAWYGWPGSRGSNTQGYLNGENYGIPQALCGSLQLVTQPGLISDYVNPANGQPGKVFAPDLLNAPQGDRIANYLFHSPMPPLTLPKNSTVLPQFSPIRSAISGTNESVSGAFAFGENIYLFYFGSPGREVETDCSIGLPIGSVSFLATWFPQPTKEDILTPKPTTYDILSRIDYNLENFTYGGCLYSEGASPCAPPWATGGNNTCSATHLPMGTRSPLRRATGAVRPL